MFKSFEKLFLRRKMASVIILFILTADTSQEPERKSFIREVSDRNLILVSYVTCHKNIP